MAYQKDWEVIVKRKELGYPWISHRPGWCLYWNCQNTQFIAFPVLLFDRGFIIWPHGLYHDLVTPRLRSKDIT